MKKDKALFWGLLTVGILIVAIILALLLFRPEPKPQAIATRPTYHLETTPDFSFPEDNDPLPTFSQKETLPDFTYETFAPNPDDPEEPTQPPVIVAPTEPGKITFPYAIPDSPLVIQGVRSYTGIFLEDGSDIPIEGVASIIITNAGDTPMDYTEIRMEGTSTTYQFTASGLPAGASMVVMEADKAPAISQDYRSISADTALTEYFERSEGIVSVVETPDGQLSVTNLTDTTIPVVRVFYKFYMEEENVYVGGITYTAKLQNLAPDSPMTVSPSHYASGSSQVLMVKIYEE